MAARHIVLLTGNPLSTNPRVIKEALALTEAGYEVRVHGAWSTEQGVETDRNLAEQGGYTFVPLLPPNTLEGRLHRLVQRAARKFAPWSVWSFGLMPSALVRAARRLNPNLAIAHSEAALFAALALHRGGCQVGVDMEDWFSEDLPANARRGRPVALLRKAEGELLRCASHATCTTEVMADSLAREYGCPRPTRIYNVFPAPKLNVPEPRDRGARARSLTGEPSRGRSAVSIHWFSQTIGPGRGLEELFAALEAWPDGFEVHLRGNLGGYEGWLQSVIPSALRRKVFVHALVSSEDLPERIAEHDIGFAGELTSIRSRDLTATNKIFQYLQSGLAVVASDTAGQREVAAAAPDAVHLYRSGDRSDLQRSLRNWLESPDELAASKAAAREVAVAKFCWEKEKLRLLDAVAAAVD
jgi:glycosyltransferase involved in cell wall biosynthesis